MFHHVSPSRWDLLILQPKCLATTAYHPHIPAATRGGTADPLLVAPPAVTVTLGDAQV